MPAAAVIPAPIAYIKVVAVKKLVVGFLMCVFWPAGVTSCVSGLHIIHLGSVSEGQPRDSWVRIIYFEEIRVLKAGWRLEYISME